LSSFRPPLSAAARRRKERPASCPGPPQHRRPLLLSSPKRYAWDEEPVGRRGGTYWKQISNDTDPAIPTPLTICAVSSASTWIRAAWIGTGNTSRPSMIFAANPWSAHRPSIPPRRHLLVRPLHHRVRLPSDQLRRLSSMVGRESLPRQLRQIRVTYPRAGRGRSSPGISRSGSGRSTFRPHPSCRSPAHLAQRRGWRTKTAAGRTLLDEAVCSQLPVLYSDISFLGGDGLNWFQIYGRQNSTTVMNVDIAAARPTFRSSARPPVFRPDRPRAAHGPPRHHGGAVHAAFPRRQLNRRRHAGKTDCRKSASASLAQGRRPRQV